MAAIDKIYLNSFDEFRLFKEWCENQPPIKDKYGKECRISNYLFYDWYDQEYWEESHPVMSAPYYIDAYIIRNCPYDFVQKELMINYGHWSQERIKSFYEDVKNWDSSKGEYPYWAKVEDFVFYEDGTITLKDLEKSDYEKILNGELYSLPYREGVEYGSHFKLVKSPSGKNSIPFERPLKGMWWVSVENANDKYDSMWYSDDTNTWDFMDEFVIGCGISSIAYVKTITALKRKIRKWKLPIGTKVLVSGRYIGEEYEFIVTK